ncbi:MAG: hypothetical protein MHMPM18_000684 [Marteilia pararefringens]
MGLSSKGSRHEDLKKSPCYSLLQNAIDCARNSECYRFENETAATCLKTRDKSVKPECFRIWDSYMRCHLSLVSLIVSYKYLMIYIHYFWPKFLIHSFLKSERPEEALQRTYPINYYSCTGTI